MVFSLSRLRVVRLLFPAFGLAIAFCGVPLFAENVLSATVAPSVTVQTDLPSATAPISLTSSSTSTPSAHGTAYKPTDSSPPTSGRETSPDQVGYASWYGSRFHGRLTASGQVYDMNKLTAAHKTLPFGTKVLVTNLDNGESVEVTINDRGPFVAGRIIDLSRAAAEAIGLTGQGVARVRLHVIKLGSGARVSARGAGSSDALPIRSSSPDFSSPTRTFGTTADGAAANGPSSSSSSPVVVQVGAFRDLGNAVRLKNFLSENGFDPLYEKWGSVTRVVLVAVPEAKIASVRQRLKKIGITSILVRHE